MTDRLLDDARRLVVAWPGRTVPLLSPMAFWWDGQHIWCSAPGDTAKVRALRRDETCALYVAPPEDEGVGLLLRGQARVFHPGDPKGLAIHGWVLAAAQAALMVKNAPSVMGYVVDAPKVPLRFTPGRRVLLRITVDEQVPITQPEVGPGIAPALPTEVPPEIRRLLAGQRRVVLATQVDGGVGLLPAVWGAGMTLRLPQGAQVAEGTPVSLVLDHDPGFRPTEVVGVSLSGRIVTAGPAVAVEATTVRWWSGFDLQTAELSGRPTATIVIPD